MLRGEKKEYRAGDQIHISVTRDFEDTATEFFQMCRKEHFNASEVIRGAIKDWLEQQKEMRRAYKTAKKEGRFVDEMVRDYEREVVIGRR